MSRTSTTENRINEHLGTPSDLLLDEQADQIFAMTDPIAERAPHAAALFA
jgi:hypothetical protein